MSLTDWLVLLMFFGFTLWDGLRGNQKNGNLGELLLAGRRMRGIAIGFSIMATQASAITFIGTTGQAYMYDMKFIQIYLGLPLAMIIICITLLPFFHKLKPYTAYEALENRFGIKTRVITGFLFLFSRGISLGITIAAPAYVLALILKVPLSSTIIIIGIGTTAYTMFGGIQGVIRTDIKQMILMLLGLVICFGWIIFHLPENVSAIDALYLAGATEKLTTIDWDFDISHKYNIWSGLIAGFFLMLSYFGADQSQVQRYLTARSLADARTSLMLSALIKIPMQFFILLLGVYMYVFYVFEERPLLFIPQQANELTDERSYESDFQLIHSERQEAAFGYLANRKDKLQKQNFVQLDRQAAQLRQAEIIRLEEEKGDSRNDTNYVLPFFILQNLPPGLIGLIIAAILAATLSSIDSMLNSLAAVTIIDGYQRLSPRKKSDRHYMKAARWATAIWGALATLSALVFGETESIIELINQIGSYFYGPILGIFLLIFVKGVQEKEAIISLIVGFIAVMAVSGLYIACCPWHLHFFFPFQHIPYGYHAWIEYLWLNPIGALVVLATGFILRKKSSYIGEVDSR